jgi:hypothetical protein
MDTEVTFLDGKTRNLQQLVAPVSPTPNPVQPNPQQQQLNVNPNPTTTNPTVTNNQQ